MDFSISELFWAKKTVIFRFLKIFENFQNGRGTKIIIIYCCYTFLKFIKRRFKTCVASGSNPHGKAKT